MQVLHQLFFMNENFAGEESWAHKHLCATEGTFFLFSLPISKEAKEKNVYHTNFINELLAVKYRRRSQIIS